MQFCYKVRHQRKNGERNEPTGVATKTSHGGIRYDDIEHIKLGANNRPGADGIEKKNNKPQ